MPSIKRHLAILILFWSVVSSALANDNLRLIIESWRAGYPVQIEGNKLHHGDKIAGFYEQNQFEPIWLRDKNLTIAGRSLIETILTIQREGLLPEDYHGAQFQNLNVMQSEQYELLLSDAFLRLTSHLQFGKVNPETLTPEWKLKKKPLDTFSLMGKVNPDESISALLQTVQPNQVRYFRLLDAYDRLEHHASLFKEPIASFPLLKKGSMDARISEIRKRLIFWGDLIQEEGEDSHFFDPRLEQAVVAFQYRHGLKADGILGKDTIAALNVPVAQRLKDIIVNMERWRWLNEQMGSRYMIVNIANYDLRIYDKSQLVFQKPVIVGRSFRKTPVFSDKIRYLVLNPTWTVPQKLAVEDKLPEIKSDPSYINRLGFTLYKAGTTETVDPAEVKWNDYQKVFPFRMVQGPGPQNALGQVKFMFPNPYDVYLHDTPARDLFSKNERAFSSGCIRVSDAVELAEFLLKEQGWNRDKLDAALATLETQTIHLKTPMPIHIEYWTAWVDKESRLHFRPDVYERDADLWKALNQPL